MKAVVDLGSNTVKYAVGDFSCGVLKIIEAKSWTTRLGAGLHASGFLSENAILETEGALKEMAAAIGKYQIPVSRAVATSAVRDATNSQRIVQAVQSHLGIQLDIISGQEEARLSFKGASAASNHAFPKQSPTLIDVGGASTEVGAFQPKFQAHSFQAGALRCQEALGLHIPPISDALWEEAKVKMAQFFPPEKVEILRTGAQGKKPLIAVGGTLLLAARLSGPSNTIEGIGIETNKSRLADLANQLRKLSIEERLKIPGLPSGRADILPCGILILLHLMNEFEKDSVFVTGWGVRHGLLLELFEEKHRKNKAQ